MLPHPMVGALYNTYQDADRLYMLIEYLPGGEVYSVLQVRMRPWGGCCCEGRVRVRVRARVSARVGVTQGCG